MPAVMARLDPAIPLRRTQCVPKRDHRDKPGDDRSVRYGGGATLGVIGKGLLGQAVEPAGLGVALDLVIEARGIERLEPVAEFREFVRRQLGDGLFEVFDGHGQNIAGRREFVIGELDHPRRCRAG